jgi:hypothetical protein
MILVASTVWTQGAVSCGEKHTRILRGKNEHIYYFEAGGTFTNHGALEG